MVKKYLFPLMAVLLLAPWPVAYAHDNGLVGGEVVQIVAAEPSAAPEWTAFGNAIGGVSNAGDLFYIDTSGESIDIVATLYLTNTDELSHYYRYLTLNVGVYVQTGADQWEPAVNGSGELIADTYLTMRNGRVSFNLPGYAKYKVTIDRGCFYCLPAGTDEGSASPKFYLTLE